MIRCIDCETLVDEYIFGRCLECHQADEASSSGQSYQQPADSLAELGPGNPEEYEGTETYETCPSCKRQFNIRQMTIPSPDWPSLCLRCDDEGPPSE